MINDLFIKKFTTKDVFYNNGLINLKMQLEKNSFEDLDCNFTQNHLEIKCLSDKERNYYDEILEKFIRDNDIVFKTKNNRLYWDKDNECFMYSNRYDIRGKSSGNDVKYLYKYITPVDIGKSTEEIFDIYIEFADKHGIGNADIKADTKIFKKGTKFKIENKCNIPVFMSKNEAIDRYIKYLVKGDIFTYDSKIHQFEDGGDCFRDMLLNKDNLIDKWDALIYWFGVKIKRYYNVNYFIYPNSNDLLTLYDVKSRLNISDDPIRVIDKKGNVKTIPTNLRLSDQLYYDEIKKNDNFYISESINEFELKLFMYFTSYMVHLEEDNNTSEDMIDEEEKNIYKNLIKISFVSYTQDGDMKSSLDEYRKTYKMISFLKKLMKTEYSDYTMFKYLADLITSISMSKNSNEKVNLNIKRFADNLLKFFDLRKTYYNVSFKILKNDRKSLGPGLYCFENMYLKEIGRGEHIMNLHEISKDMGNGIGIYAFNVGKDGKNILFKLRNIKNKKQMIAYFKDLEFTILKNEALVKFSKQINDSLEKVFEAINSEKEKSEDWEIIRDYIAIYAINKYRSINSAKKLQGLKGGK
ncbi:MULTISPECIES: hypothetical protein [Clostridium]|uniref:hypothetical protein n=1 Tax=Clostridium TaxID=1485 RepID=UPI0008265AA7|nr:MULTISPECIES: hypothetical protein [Clostridium]PJI07105.1 hypothetical protein CUB90_04160 [Clostridium sp. CT7]